VQLERRSPIVARSPLARALALALGALVLGAAGGALAADEPERPRLVVSGSGRVSAVPDTAHVVAGAITEAETAADALEANNAILRKVMRALRQAEIEERDVQTEAFGVWPPHHPDREGGRPPEITGYTVSNRLRVTVRDLDRLGPILDTLVSQDANQVHGISFSVAEPEAIVDEARKLAVADARRKAQILARAAGVQLGALLHVEEQGGATPVPRVQRMALAESAVPVARGELDFAAGVRMTWEIGP
jgi:uncharacterized protein YggE